MVAQGDEGGASIKDGNYFDRDLWFAGAIGFYLKRQ